MNQMLLRRRVEAIDATQYKIVDLGLPSGTLWSDRNIGAKSIEGTGYRYAWGDLVARTSNMSHNDYQKTPGAQIDTLEIPLSLDAAYAFDSSLKMPTADDFRELIGNTTRSVETINGISVIRYTGTNGKSIIFPRVSIVTWSSSNNGANTYAQSMVAYYFVTRLPNDSGAQVLNTNGYKRSAFMVRAIKRM